MTQEPVEDIARRRLRSLRVARGWSLDELSRRSLIDPSTISRIETGRRRLSLDQLLRLASALETSVEDLVGTASDEDVVIRPTRGMMNGVVVWPLTRHHDASGRSVTKMRIPASTRRPTPRIHPGRDWFFVLDGTARLFLGDREHLVEAGQAADFDTMTPHWIAGFRGPVEVLAIFDNHGERAHLHP
jgi:transcriptional regulator with XRE-family HTH domain